MDVPLEQCLSYPRYHEDMRKLPQDENIVKCVDQTLSRCRLGTSRIDYEGRQF